ncbi:hypothetical protein HKX48_000547 [Thoreauomyces humboldtii]|nr:hypothetical protein HKX48_000547 [Thoreauomyces humboldtii]
MSVPAIFQDATRTGATHRKNVVALRKLHLRKGPALNADIRDCVLRVLPLKKGNQEAERVLKFLTSYLEEFESGDEVAAQILEGLVSELLELALRGLKVKDKVVRYRSCTMIRLLLNHMDEIDEEKFIEIQEALFERTRDKESTVRVQAALAVSRLQDSPDEDDEDSVAQNEQVRECLLAMLQHDTSSEVRKAVLWNISVDSSTLPFILQRTRDVDPQVRRFAFKKIGQDVEKMVHLTADERDVILHNGLSDRDSNVQKAAVALLCDHWIPQCEDSLLNLLHKMDVVSGNAAEPIVKAYMLANPATQMKYDEETWNNLDVEEAFLLRMAITFYGENKQQDELDAALPPLGKHADLLQKYALLMAQTTDQDEAISFAFILKQLLLVGELQDFGDEMGRRDLLLCLRKVKKTGSTFGGNLTS